ncbi:MAG: hypothetical protein H7Y09_14965 [Chitinophagaceae bacterium]|nr:hypothetical protein [Anaerolineae bacterium]
MIQIDEVKQLLEQADETTLTLYLNVDPHSSENVSANPGWKKWAKNALRDVEGEVAQDRQDMWNDIRARTEQLLKDYQPQNKSLGLLVGQSFERTFDIPFTIENQVSFGKPNVMPLLWALDEYEPYLIALVDQNEARFFLSYLGQIGFQDSLSIDLNVGEGPQFTAMPSNHSVARGSQEDKVKDRLEEHVTRMFRDVVNHLQKLADKHQVRRIILGGNDEAAHHVRILMPDKMAESVVAVLPIPILTDTQEMIEKVLPAALEYERQQEIKLVQEVIDLAKAGGRGALGWEAVRQALQMQQVELLILPWPVVDDSQATDLTLKTFASSGKIELVHGEAAQLLGGEGGLAARLYYAL